eukprot:g32353.t1
MDQRVLRKSDNGGERKICLVLVEVDGHLGVDAGGGVKPPTTITVTLRTQGSRVSSLSQPSTVNAMPSLCSTVGSQVVNLEEMDQEGKVQAAQNQQVWVSVAVDQNRLEVVLRLKHGSYFQ